MPTQYLICVTTKFYGNKPRLREYIEVMTDNDGFKNFAINSRDCATRLSREEAKEFLELLNEGLHYLPHNAYSRVCSIVKA